MGYQFTISADTPDEFSKRIVGLYRALKETSDILFGGNIPPLMEPETKAEPVETPVESKRRGRPPKPQTIDATAVEVKKAGLEETLAQIDIEEAIVETRSEALSEIAEMDAPLIFDEPKAYTQAEIAKLLPEWNSEMKQKPAAVAAAKMWLLYNNTGPKCDEIAKKDEKADAARLLVMQLLQIVGAERISTIPEDKYGEVVAFVEAQRAQFGG